MIMSGGVGMGESQAVSMPARNKYERHERRVGKFTGLIRRGWYNIGPSVSKITHKILIDWPFRLICRHVVDMNLLSHTEPSAPLNLKEIEGYKSHGDWLEDHCKHGWWWQEHGGKHNFLVHFRYKQDALQFKLIWG